MASMPSNSGRTARRWAGRVLRSDATGHTRPRVTGPVTAETKPSVKLTGSKCAFGDVDISKRLQRHSLYTYGAVATAKIPLLDLSKPDHSFDGLRCYTETLLLASRQTDIAAIFNVHMYHAQMPTLALHWQKDSEYYPGSGRPELPNHSEGRAGDIGHHDMKNYIDRLTHLQLAGKDVSKHEPFLLGSKLALLAWGAYEQQTMWTTKKEVTMEDLIRDHLPQWRMVAHTQQDTLEAVDNIFIVQNEKTLDCSLAFQGTHTFAEFFGNLKGAGDGYCGFLGVHKGYADKLWWLMKYSMPKLRPYLKKCKKALVDHRRAFLRARPLQVMCTGHSLGGSLCEAIASCLCMF